MNNIIKYNEFIEKLKYMVYIKSRIKLMNDISHKPNKYLNVFRFAPTKLELTLKYNNLIEMNFNGFIKSIITEYLGKYYTNLDKRKTYKGETILFDQLFIYNDKVFMIEQKMRDDHDSTRKRGQFENFIKKIEYLKETYPNKEIEAGMWFVDETLTKNKYYYSSQIKENKSENVKLHLFYGREFTDYLDNVAIWDEMNEYLLKWQMSKENGIELNFELDWLDTKKELLEGVSKNSWKKIMNNKEVLNKILPILFPTNKYKEILTELNIDV